MVNESANAFIKPGKKRLVLVFDGTGCNQDTADTFTSPTILARQTTDDGIPQVTLYIPGPGTAGSKMSQLWDGMVGGTVDKVVRQAYLFLSYNYSCDPADQIYMFGFSRGAYAARLCALLVQTLGILKETKLKYFEILWSTFQKNAATMRDETEWSMLFQSALHKINKAFTTDVWPVVWEGVYREDLEDLKIFHDRATLNIEALVIWDTVRAVGFPGVLAAFIDERILGNKLPDLISLSDKRVHNVFHAISLDEKRSSFPVLLFKQLKSLRSSEGNNQGYRQVWFAGQHSDIGGGYEDARATLYPFAFMASELIDRDLLQLNTDYLCEFIQETLKQKRYTYPLHDMSMFWRMINIVLYRTPFGTQPSLPWNGTVWKGVSKVVNYLTGMTRELNAAKGETLEQVHWSVPGLSEGPFDQHWLNSGAEYPKNVIPKDDSLWYKKKWAPISEKPVYAQTKTERLLLHNERSALRDIISTPRRKSSNEEVSDLSART